MADQADVYVTNLSKEGDVIISYCNSGGDCTTVPNLEEGDVRGFLAFMINESLVITPPKGVHWNAVKYRSKIDLDLICSRTDSNWILKIKPNSLPQEAPVTVNVTIGDN